LVKIGAVSGCHGKPQAGADMHLDVPLNDKNSCRAKPYREIAASFTSMIRRPDASNSSIATGLL
jgi:hypothetical protein